VQYVLITPARNEAQNLGRLAECVERQTIAPQRWLLVDDGSTDDTADVMRELAARHAWVTFLESPGVQSRGGALHLGRGSGRDIIAFHAGITELSSPSDFVFKLDADVSFADDYIARQLGKFEADSRLGIASGTCYERVGDVDWKPYFVARNHVRGATRCYRWECLQDVLPLEERIGWDAVDEIKANLRGWTTTSFRDLAFYHHRPLGARDGTREAWILQGELAHFLGYRFSYLVARALFRRARREAHALAMIPAFAAARSRQAPRADAEVIRHLRRQQSFRKLPLRLRQALGKAA
jgi:poly-beta-1,6-N-acetyl-D-glucosamine synthase